MIAFREEKVTRKAQKGANDEIAKMQASQKSSTAGISSFACSSVEASRRAEDALLRASTA